MTSLHEKSPHLHLLTALRLLLATHLLLCALPIPSLPLSTITPSYLPLFLLISGFTSTYSKSHTRPHFLLRRFAALYPLYLTSILIHLTFFTKTSLPIRRSLLSSIFLTPYLSSSLAFPITDTPFLAANLIPALAICYLAFPTLLSLMPRPKPSASLQISTALLAIYLLTILQAFWLSHLPNTTSTRRSLMLIDIAAYVPFLADLPAFLLGILLALHRQSNPRPNPDPRHPILPALLFLASATTAAYILPFVKPTSFTDHFLLRSALLPPFALLVYTLSAFSSDIPILRHTTPLAYTIYALTMPAWHALGHLCHTTSPIPLVCIQDPPQLSPVPWWLSWAPWYAVPTVASAAADRAIQHAVLSYPGAYPIVYLPVLLAVSGLVYYLFQMRVARAIPVWYGRLEALCADGRLGTRVNALMGVRQSGPFRDNDWMERAIRVVVYYVACGSFLVFAYCFSRPISNQLIAADPLSLLCWLPNFLYPCDTKDEGMQGLLGRFGIGAVVVTKVIDVFRWIVFLTLPVMTFNVIGHTVFPRAIWRRLPTVSHMINSQTKSAPQESEQLTGAGEGAGNGHGGIMKRILNAGIGKEAALTNRLDMNFVLYIRYVTRGKNPHLVAENAIRAARILSECGLPRRMWRVEVVTDQSIQLAQRVSDESVYEIVVPSDYSPANGALYKARALNYAISASPAGPHDWIVHLDEETRFEADTIRAILYHCGRESYLTYVAKSQKWPRIGQGPIIFGHAMIETDMNGDGDGNWVTTLADSGRVSDDCGRYRIQFECGEVWVGMHGSFVVAANCVEMDVTFDHGAEGSIAEDAYFALLARSRDVRFAWVDALMFEQSPFTFMDFIKQRARWLVGGLRVVSSDRIPLRVRIVMMCLSTTWALMPITYLVLILSALFGSGDNGGGGDRLYFRILLPLLATFSLWNYMFGFFVTFSVRKVGLVRFLVLLYAQLVLSPVFGVMEVSSVSYALWNFKKLSVGFHVVQKERLVEGREGDTEQVDELTRLL